MEYVRSQLPFGGFPWLNVGYSQTDFLRIIQIADLVGVYGVSFLVVWINAALVFSLTERKRVWRSLLPTMLGVGMLTASLIYGDRSLRKWDQVKTQYKAALLQGNLSIDESDASLMWKYQDGYVSMADRLGPQKIDLLVLPEAPSPMIYQYDAHYREAMQALARRFPMGLVFNNIYYREVDGRRRYFNSSYILDRNGREAGRYDKIHLVPFGEYIPWQKVFFFSETISKDVGNFCPGESYSTFSLSGHTANTIICFEAVFPDLVREFIQTGKSELIINLTNDAWYGDTSAPYQHLAMARWRAVENRRFLLRAANSGISAILSPSGRIRERTGLLLQDTAVGEFAFLSGTTVYTNHGGLPVFLCAIITFLVLAYGAWKGRKAES
jgi:apolipoprotein N-acyltransferase